MFERCNSITIDSNFAYATSSACVLPQGSYISYRPYFTVPYVCHPLNCTNCGAPLKNNYCEYCGTSYNLIKTR